MYHSHGLIDRCSLGSLVRNHHANKCHADWKSIIYKVVLLFSRNETEEEFTHYTPVSSPSSPRKVLAWPQSPWRWPSWDPEPSNECVSMSGLRRRKRCGLQLGSPSDQDSLSEWDEEKLHTWRSNTWCTGQFLQTFLCSFSIPTQRIKGENTHTSYIACGAGAGTESGKITSTYYMWMEHVENMNCGTDAHLYSFILLITIISPKPISQSWTLSL